MVLSGSYAVDIGAFQFASNTINDNRPRSIHGEAPYEERLFQYTANSHRQPGFLIF